MNLTRLIAWLEAGFFTYRRSLLALLAVITLLLGWCALHLRMEAGFDKQMPVGHPYIQTLEHYRSDLPGTNRLTVVVRARSGSLWTVEGLSRLHDVTQAVSFLPNVQRAGVQSLWTPNTFVNEITEEGFRSEPIIPGTVTKESLTEQRIAQIQNATSQGGYVGSMVSYDQSAAMITAELNEIGPDGKKIDYVDYNRLLEREIRRKFEDDKYEIEIIGFAKMIGDIADGAVTVVKYIGLSLALLFLAVYWYCRSWRLSLLPIACSFTSLIWQFGTLRLLGLGLDPLAVLVPFLVFAIGVSHGVQQINFIVRGLVAGKSSMQAARESFCGLLIPGTLALITALVSFITLLLIPIPMTKELAITASVGVLYKVVTNLVMLPVMASFVTLLDGYAEKAKRLREKRARVIKLMAFVVRPKSALAISAIALVVLGVSAWESRDRIVGTLEPGAPELRSDSRFNRDAVAISGNFDLGLDWLTVVLAAPPDSCGNPAIGLYMDGLGAYVGATPGVISYASYATQLRTYNQGYNEGYPKMDVVPVDPGNYAGLSAEIARVRGFNSKDCSMTALHIFLADHKAETIKNVIDAINHYGATRPPPQEVQLKLAAGNAGILAATNETLERSELPMLLYVYVVIVVLVLVVYRDLRAAIACCLPLTIGTFIGYWFMKEAHIGLTVATLPVMVLAVGIGVDYALYIYNRLQMHLANGDSMFAAMQRALEFEGMATIFTAITLAIGVVTWSFSALKFQADMGKLLAFMFMVNLVMAFTALPAFAVVLERLFPRKSLAYSPSVLAH